MKQDIPIKNGIVIPAYEIELITSRAGGPGGQHVNKSNTKVTLRWNVAKTQALTDDQKERVIKNLSTALTTEGDLIIHSSTYRSQKQNKLDAYSRLATIIKKALCVPKKRIPTKKTAAAQEKRLKAKYHRSNIKKMRGKKIITE